MTDWIGAARQAGLPVTDRTRVILATSGLVFLPDLYGAELGPTKCGRWVDKSGLIAWLWRILGQIFQRPSWIRRGRTFVEVPVATRFVTEMLQLERFAGIPGVRAMGYNPRIDVLAVMPDGGGA